MRLIFVVLFSCYCLQAQFIPQADVDSIKHHVAYLGDDAKLEAIKMASTLRQDGIAVALATGDRSLKAQLRQADSLGSKRVVVIGDEELKNQSVTLRNMMTGEQQVVLQSKLQSELRKA